MRQNLTNRRRIVIACCASALVHGGTLWAVANWIGPRHLERPQLGSQSGLIVLESAFRPASAPPQPAVQIKFAEEQVLVLPDRAELAQRQFVETPAHNVPLTELLSSESLEQLAAREPSLSPTNDTKEMGDALAMANAPADAKMQLARTPAPKQPNVSTAAASSPSQAAPRVERGLRTGPSFDGNAPPRYPEVARRNRWEGQVLLRVFISAEGNVTNVEVARSSGHDLLDATAAAAVRTWRAAPAIMDGEAVATEELLPVRFRLR